VGRLQPTGPKRQAGGALRTPLRTRGAWAAWLGAGHTQHKCGASAPTYGLGTPQRIRGA